MAEAFIGEIRIFPYTFPPRNWADCSGQLLAISQQQSLFALIGTIYGGDGRTTFQLPDFRGRSAVHVGTGPGLTPRMLGERAGLETVSLTVDEIPSHSHAISCDVNTATESDPTGSVMAIQRNGRDSVNQYAATPDSAMASSSVTGGAYPHENRPPSLVMRFCICLYGLWPSRN